MSAREPPRKRHQQHHKHNNAHAAVGNVGRLHVRNTHLFNPTSAHTISQQHDKKSSSMGRSSTSSTAATWAGRGVTRTSPSFTLFVTNIPSHITTAQVEMLFRSERGFFAVRAVRRMTFVDFDTIPDATRAMRKFQDYTFDGVAKGHGLLIDYDKDPQSKRDRQFKKQRNRELHAEEAKLVRMTCVACAAVTMKLKLDAKPFAKLPRRPVDQSVVVNRSKYVRELKLNDTDEVVGVKRADGKIESQYRLICDCGVPIAYTPQPRASEPKFLFLFDGAATPANELTSARSVLLSHGGRGVKRPATTKPDTGPGPGDGESADATDGTDS
jgi:RNA recognition motif